MPEHNTRQATVKRLEEAVLRLTQSQQSLSQNHASLAQAQTTMDSKIDSILERLAQLALPPPTSPKSSPPSSPLPRPHMKLDIPRFDGQDPLGWIFKITQFFEYHCILNTERLTVASFYMEGPALCWYQWMSRNGLLTSWPAMFQALEARFALSYYDDPHGALFKLQQRGSVNDYLSDFERLANRTIRLAHPLLLSYFISGLNPKLRREVQALQQISLPQAIALAKLQEDKLHDRRRTTRFSSSQRLWPLLSVR